MDYCPNTDPFCVEFDINQPKVDEIYYSSYSNINESNRRSQDDFQLERKLQAKDWSIRVNTSILGLNDVYTYYLGKYFEWWYYRNPEEFCYNLT